MGFFKRVFQRKSKEEEVASSGRKSKSQATSRSPQKAESSITDIRDDETNRNSHSLADLGIGGQLSRITEEGTLVSRGSNLRGYPVEPVPPPPTAREAAFRGPPRFDWMDIERHAATKVQSIYRRNRVMDKMEEAGYSTSAIRNRRRRRKASRQLAISEDTPSVFACCAVGLAFGDATEEEEEAYREFQKQQYEERVKQQEAHEDAIRKRYLREHGIAGKVVEQIEVVE